MHKLTLSVKILHALARIVRLNVVAVSILFTASAYAADSDLANQLPQAPHEHIEIGLDQDGKHPLVEIDAQSLILDQSTQSTTEISKLISEKSQLKNTTVVVSTDSVELMRAAEANPDINPDAALLIPLEKSTSLESTPRQKSSFSQLVKEYAKAGFMAARDDKIGFLILTYTTSAETIIWIHSTNLSQFERTGSVMYTITLALVFGLNKDAWSNATAPFKKFYRSLLKPDSDDPNSLKELATRFLGNMTLGAAVTALRIPLMSMDKIIASGVKFEYFTTPLLMTLVTTAAYFTWSEHLASIDMKTNPTTKFIFRRMTEMRSIVVGTFATTAALLTPGQYGVTPWITVAALGSMGALIYFNSSTITAWIESNPYLLPLRRYLERGRDEYSANHVMLCRDLFSH